MLLKTRATDPPPLSWDRLVELEPRLEHLHRQAASWRGPNTEFGPGS